MAGRRGPWRGQFGSDTAGERLSPTADLCRLKGSSRGCTTTSDGSDRLGMPENGACRPHRNRLSGSARAGWLAARLRLTRSLGARAQLARGTLPSRSRLARCSFKTHSGAFANRLREPRPRFKASIAPLPSRKRSPAPLLFGIVPSAGRSAVVAAHSALSDGATSAHRAGNR